MTLEWQTWPCMQPYLHAKPMRTLSGGTSTANSISSTNNLTVLSHWFHVIQPQQTLEIGLAYGASATLFCELHRQQGRGGKHHAIDPFQKDNWHGAALAHLQDSALDSCFTFHADYSSQVLPRLCSQAQTFDLIYIDGSHLFEDVFLDFFYAHQLLNIGGVLAFDDSSDANVLKVIRFIRANFASMYDEHPPYEITRPQSGRLFRVAAKKLGRQQLTLFLKKASGPRPWITPLKPF